jgi:uncharacterized phage protein gp47/JayE
VTFVSNSSTGNPVLDYSSRDYASIYADLQARQSTYLPEWTSASPSDFGQVLLQMYAYMGDLLSYYLDRLAGEAFIQTATQPSSIINLAAMLDYQPTLANGAIATLQVTISPSVGAVTIPAGTAFSTVASSGTPAIPFITTQSLSIAGGSAATPAISGTVTAVQATQYTSEAVATSNGVINQTYPLQNSPVSAGSFTVSVDLGDGNGPQPWAYSQSLIDNGPYDKVYTNYIDANGVFYIIFGDNVNGYVPPLGSPITCTYQTTVGAAGNVGANTIVQPVTAIVGVVGVTNPLAANEGADAESLASIQASAPASLKTLNRGVTVSDTTTLAMQVPGVLWASAIESTYQLVNLYIAPFGGGALNSTLSAAVLAYVQPLMMANTTVTVLSPVYVPINISANVAVLDNYGATAVISEVQTALANLLAVSNSLSKYNTGFGMRVALGLVYQTILQIPGVNWAIITGLTRSTLTTTTAMAGATAFTAIPVSPLPQVVYGGDPLVLIDKVTGAALQSAVAAGALGTIAAPVGATLIPISSSFTTPGGGFPAGTIVQDTEPNDCIMLNTEIPVAGTIALTPISDTFGS